MGYLHGLGVCICPTIMNRRWGVKKYPFPSHFSRTGTSTLLRHGSGGIRQEVRRRVHEELKGPIHASPACETTLTSIHVVEQLIWKNVTWLIWVELSSSSVKIRSVSKQTLAAAIWQKNNSKELRWLPWKYMDYIFNMFLTPAQPLFSSLSSFPTPNSPTQILPRPVGFGYIGGMLTELHHGRTWHQIRIIERLGQSEHRCRSKGRVLWRWDLGRGWEIINNYFASETVENVYLEIVEKLCLKLYGFGGCKKLWLLL